MIRLQQIDKRRGDLTIHRGLSLTLSAGDALGLYGPSGCGKTTLLNLLAGLEQPDQGTRHCRADLRIGYLFQEPRLLPWCTVAENLQLVAPQSSVDAQRATLSQLGLADCLTYYPRQLSLGMARRVALARALLINPLLLLLDEPFASLDSATAAQVADCLLSHQRATPALALVIASHDQPLCQTLCTRHLRLNPTAHNPQPADPLRQAAPMRLG